MENNLISSGGDLNADISKNSQPSVKLLSILFCGCVVLFHINGGTSHVGVDTLAAPYTAWALLRTGSLDVSDYADLEPWLDMILFEDGPEGERITTRPLGTTLVMDPFVAPFDDFQEEPLSFRKMGQLGKLASSLCIAGAVIFFFLLCRRFIPQATWLATILFAFGNCLWSVASQSIWMHGPATLCLTGALYFMLRSSPQISWRDALLAGFLLGMAVWTRPSTGLFALASGACLLFTFRIKAMSALVVGGIVPVICHISINILWYGNWLYGGYHSDNWQMPTPLWLGVSGLLVAPSRGLFLYTPALVLVPVGLIALVRGNLGETLQSYLPRIMLGTWFLASVLTICFFAKWYDWYGGWCFGPRFLCETMPVLCLLFGIGFGSLKFLSWRRVAIGLVGLSVAIQAIGVFGRTAETNWYKTYEKADRGRWLFSFQETQIEAYGKMAMGKFHHRLFRLLAGLGLIDMPSSEVESTDFKFENGGDG